MPKGVKPRTAWKPGQSGNPDGKALTAALRKRANDPAMDEDGNEIIEKDASGKRRYVKRLEIVADQLLRKAMKGDQAAIEEVFNRLDGKVANVNMNVETPLDGADTSSLAALQEALEGLAKERDPEAAGSDEGETLH